MSRLETTAGIERADSVVGTHTVPAPMLPMRARGRVCSQSAETSPDAGELDYDSGTDNVDQLAALIEAGGFWRLAPEWVPRTGYAEPTLDLLRVVEVGLLRRLPG